MSSIWSSEKNLAVLRRVKTKELTTKEAAALIGCSLKAVQRKLDRVTPEAEAAPEGRVWKEWADADLMALYAMRSNKKDWMEIGAALDRTSISCERKWQTTNWTTYLTSHAVAPNQTSDDALPLVEKRIAAHILDLARCNPDRLSEMTKAFVLSKIEDAGVKDFDFDRVMGVARQELEAMGSLRQAGKKFGEGTYIVVSDSHGKHTRRAMFQMLAVLKDQVKADKIVHIGHILDDDNDISCCWNELDDVVVVSKNTELRHLCKLGDPTPEPVENDSVKDLVVPNTESKAAVDPFRHEVLRNHIYLGKLMVGNQEIIQDYSLTPLASLPRLFFEQSSILNLHRQELETRTTCHEDTQIYSPGCLCEPHIVKTIKQIDFTTDKTVKLAYHSGFSKYQKMEHFVRSWEKGLCVVHVDKDGNFDVVQTRIHRTSKGWTCSYFDKIITESGVLDAKHRIFISGDTHVDLHDQEVLDLQEQFCQAYLPNTSVDVGDMLNNKGFNHHIMSRQGHMGIDHRVIDEIAHCRWILERRSKWAEKQTLLFGNHERFNRDFNERAPQFKEIFNLQFMLNLQSMGIELVEEKQLRRMGSLQFAHGDIKMFGARGGSKLDKIFNTFGPNTVIGHGHSPTVRMGCYMVGFSGVFDQEYNETEASKWMQGFGYCNIFEDVPFITLVHIRNKRFAINGKIFTPVNPDNWSLPPYKAQIAFAFAGKEESQSPRESTFRIRMDQLKCRRFFQVDRGLSRAVACVTGKKCSIEMGTPKGAIDGQTWIALRKKVEKEHNVHLLIEHDGSGYLFTVRSK